MAQNDILHCCTVVAEDARASRGWVVDKVDARFINVRTNVSYRARVRTNVLIS